MDANDGDNPNIAALTNGLFLKDCVNPSDETIIGAVTNCPEAIQYVSLDQLNDGLVKRLLDVSCEFILGFPITYMNSKRILRAISSNPSLVATLNDDHYSFITAQDLIRVTLKAYPYLRSDDITEDLSKYCVIRYPELYKNIPERFKTKEFNREVVQKNTKLITYIPEAHINRKLVARLLFLNPDCYYLLPEKWRKDYASGLKSKPLHEE